ncbi:MAG: deoxyribodipyrimidine photo-lyase [Porticoccaceae bacterium]|nr:deoxyribodipyrimidine photo-lyase [Porticoccaceae bacterium]
MNLVWFRNDLRLRDNPALWHSCQDGVTGGIFILTPEQWRNHGMAAVRIDFLLRNLRVLSRRLHEIGIPLIIEQAGRFADVPEILHRNCQQLGVEGLYWNDEYPLDEQRRDQSVQDSMAGAGIDCHRFHDRTIAPPGSVLKKDGEPYQVFTPFKRTWQTLLDLGPPELFPAPLAQSVPELPRGVSTEIPGAIEGFDSPVPASLWPAGEEEAQKKLDDFCRNRIGHYERDRDFPGVEGTSTLSPYLAIGALSPQQCLRAALEARSRGSSAQQGADSWINELVWRDFYQHLVVAYTHLCKGQPFKAETAELRWRNSEEDFERWCRGETGVPIVDAGMRQLLRTGWMHNRVRMITAMFLTKNLLIDWRRGEHWFMTHLVDGDFAANNGGWQWSASTGTDAAPYFRIFNPFTQAERFDPEARYIKHFVPELKDLEPRQIHRPDALGKSRPAGYPDLMVDLKKSRQAAIDAFKDLQR